MAKSNTPHLVIGNGEVGSALREILAADIMDLNFQQLSSDRYEFLHICFPYKDSSFLSAVKTYQDRFGPRLTIIHSTVPVGTTSRLDAVHSPIRGVHPFMTQGIRTFVKYFGGPKAAAAAEPFVQLGLK